MHTYIPGNLYSAELSLSPLKWNQSYLLPSRLIIFWLPFQKYLSPTTILFILFWECWNIQRYHWVVYMITFRRREWKWKREVVGCWGWEEQWVAENDKQVGFDTRVVFYPPILVTWGYQEKKMQWDQQHYHRYSV